MCVCWPELEYFVHVLLHFVLNVVRFEVHGVSSPVHVQSPKWNSRTEVQYVSQFKMVGREVKKKEKKKE